MQVSGAARATAPLGGTDSLTRKRRDDEVRQAEELTKVAQMYGPKVAQQLAEQLQALRGGQQGGDLSLSDIDGSKSRDAAGTSRQPDDLERLLKDILKKQETASAAAGAHGAGAQGQQQQQPQMAQDVNLVQARDLSQIY